MFNNGLARDREMMDISATQRGIEARSGYFAVAWTILQLGKLSMVECTSLSMPTSLGLGGF